MKTILFIFSMLSVLSLHANQIDYKLSIKNLDAMSIVVYLDFELENDYSISIIDIKDRNLWNSHFEDSKSFIQKFNLNYLENGLYYIEIEDNSRVIKYPLVIRSRELIVKPKRETSKPVFKLTDELVDHQSNRDGESTTQNSIEKRNNELLSKKNIDSTWRIRKLFDLSKLSVRPNEIQTSIRDWVLEYKVK